jgi:glycosyltransferase involved in cell wall biosynthesis
MNVAIIIDSVPSYRRGFYENLLTNADIALTVFCQSHIRGFNLQLIQRDLGERFIEIPFVSSKSHRWAWQRLPVLHLWRSYDVYVFHGNPRIMSTLVWATMFRILGKKVVIWGQAHTAGAASTTESLRLCWWRLFRNVLVYTDAEVRYLRKRGFKMSNIISMNNGLNQKEIEQAKQIWTEKRLISWQKAEKLSDRAVILSCARLVKKNRYHLMIEALPEILRGTPDLVWCIIGTGSEKNELATLAERYGVVDNIRWVGEIYEEEELAPWFMSSTLLVHPGAIGLTLMHAFGYGLPVVTHDNAAFQMPEFAALIRNINGLCFRENDVVDLVSTVNTLLQDKTIVEKMSAAALETVRRQYNTDVMADRFIQTARSAARC